MKRIILGLSLFLMLLQNGFAETDAEWDKLITNAPNEVLKQIQICNKSTLNHPDSSDVHDCLKVIPLKKKAGNFKDSSFAITYLNIGTLYNNSENNYMKSYEYFMKSAKLGNTDAQRNLDILCKRHSWVCK